VITSKADSVTEAGEHDGWAPSPGWFAEVTPQGDTRLTISVPRSAVVVVHAALLRAAAEPLSFLYRQKVDRREPGPRGAPPRDFVALGASADAVLAALQDAELLVYGDARCEVWVRGAMGEQVVLDEDGLLYVYPDDPAFREALAAQGVPGDDVETMADRDYVKHWFRAEADEAETRLIAALQLTEVAPRGGR